MVPRLLFGSMTLAAAMCVGSSGPPGESSQGAAAPQQQITVPTVAEMERDLHVAHNEERTARGLTAVRVLPQLVELARRHSADMAARETLSHESGAGKTYQQRLADAGIQSIANGENVGRSGTFLTRLIHQSFMDSAVHRENILNPLFDAVGIGVVLGNRGVYFVTVDFIKSFALKSGADIRAIMLGALNDARARAHLAPVQLLDAVNAMADTQAQAKAEGRDLPPVPIKTWRTSTRFVAGLDMDRLADAVREQRVDGFGLAGIGSAFGRNREHPEGAYVICVLLVWNGA